MSSLKLDLAAILAKHLDAAPEIRSGISKLIKTCDEITKQVNCPHLSPETKTDWCAYGEYSITTCRACGKVLKTENNW